MGEVLRTQFLIPPHQSIDRAKGRTRAPSCSPYKEQAPTFPAGPFRERATQGAPQAVMVRAQTMYTGIVLVLGADCVEPATARAGHQRRWSLWRHTSREKRQSSASGNQPLRKHRSGVRHCSSASGTQPLRLENEEGGHRSSDRHYSRASGVQPQVNNLKEKTHPLG